MHSTVGIFLVWDFTIQTHSKHNTDNNNDCEWYILKIYLTIIFTVMEKGWGRNFTTPFHITIGINLYPNWDTVLHFFTFRRKKGWGRGRVVKNVTVMIYWHPHLLSIDHLQGISIFIKIYNLFHNTLNTHGKRMGMQNIMTPFHVYSN